MGFLRSTKGSIISDYFKLQEDIAGFSKGYMYDVALYDDHLEITSMQKRKLLLNYNQITDVFYGGKTELIQKPKSVIGRAVVGGVIFGGVGAIVGASMGSRKTVTKVQSMDILIRLKDSYTGAVVVKILNSPIKSNSMFYDTFINAAKDILSKLTQITMDKPTVQISEADD